MMLRMLTLILAGLLALPLAAEAQKPIKVGFPMILSGPGALFGEPASKGAQMYVDEINAAGGVLGRKIELVPRDTKGNADEAVRVSRELILKENVDFLVGTLTSAEGPAVSVVAKENKVVFIAPIPKTDQLTAPDKLHPYVFRISANTTMEGRSAAEIVAKWPVTKVATISFDYAYGQDVTKAFVEHLKKLKPSAQIVDQQWPKLGEQDYNPFINAQMGKKPEAIFSSIWGGFFVTYSKQAKALGVFDAVKYNFIGVGEAGSPETDQVHGQGLSGGDLGQLLRRLLLGRDGRPTATTWRGWPSTSRTSTRRRGPSRATPACSSSSRASRRPAARTPTRSPRRCSGSPSTRPSASRPFGRRTIRRTAGSSTARP